ncbi:MAG: Inner membrane protein YhaH [Stenotrophomonas maltophilia]|uniref:Inner membrane protein YhaH n=1 Tax=Stenotrophomonas maltophilia TaxID=40324 RepID=A0A7V8JKK7_STEMA|nr:MAG: Inner membrane protein YhaH [Stenotrophomonas maltophilia]
MLKMMMPLKRYAQFSGRASRSEFWLFQLFIMIVSIPLYVLGFIAGYTDSQALALASTCLSVVMWLTFVLPSLAVTVRRLHDTDRSGWWLLLGLVPIVGVVLLVFAVLPSTPGGNRFGVSAPRD